MEKWTPKITRIKSPSYRHAACDFKAIYACRFILNCCFIFIKRVVHQRASDPPLYKHVNLKRFTFAAIREREIRVMFGYSIEIVSNICASPLHKHIFNFRRNSNQWSAGCGWFKFLGFFFGTLRWWSCSLRWEFDLFVICDNDVVEIVCEWSCLWDVIDEIYDLHE